MYLTNTETQRLVDSHFERGSAFWNDVYERDDVVGRICPPRRDIARRWIDELELPARARVLEVSCALVGCRLNWPREASTWLPPIRRST